MRTVLDVDFCSDPPSGVDINLVRSEGDAYIVTATCAFAHADYPAAEDLAEKGAAASSKGGRAHNLFVAEYAAERQGKDGTSHREAGLEAAKQSGQCEGAQDADACADGYRASIRQNIEIREREAQDEGR